MHIIDKLAARLATTALRTSILNTAFGHWPFICASLQAHGAESTCVHQHKHKACMPCWLSAAERDHNLYRHNIASAVAENPRMRHAAREDGPRRGTHKQRPRLHRPRRGGKSDNADTHDEVQAVRRDKFRKLRVIERHKCTPSGIGRQASGRAARESGSPSAEWLQGTILAPRASREGLRVRLRRTGTGGEGRRWPAASAGHRGSRQPSGS
mmetsp:Transcript_29584/g.95574  ORF Transcript_29584/g.95574 Transcript_29584/m.95574 type:complete len:211 (+) Transcript_29584:21-653(+)